MDAVEKKAAADAAADTMMQVLNDAEWQQLIERLGGDDTYHRAGYHRASVHLEPCAAVPVYLHFQDTDIEVALPLLVRPLGPDFPDYFDATSAYGYGGPLVSGVVGDSAETAAFREKFAAALNEWARSNGVIATFLRSHPLLDNAAFFPANAEIIELGKTVAWSVVPGRELLPSMHSHHRRAARKADRAELAITITENPADLSAFRTLYDETMRRQNATAFYFFSDAYWDAMRHEPDVELVLVDGTLNGEVVASLLCFRAGDALHYHLGASADAARSIGASNRCFLAAAEWAQAQGMRVFHLGGGYGGGTDSPLFVFKHRYDPESEPRSFHIGKIVHNAAAYKEVSGSDSTAGYFPPWREQA